MINGLSRINEISKKDIDFNQPILFEKKPVLNDEFCKTLGESIIEKINDEFTWNLFFRILFEIEPYNNKKDFENFMEFIKVRVISKDSIEQIISYYGECGKIIIKEIYLAIARTLIKVDTVEILYDYNLEKINFIIGESISNICRDIEDYEEYLELKDEIINKIEKKIIKLFN